MYPFNFEYHKASSVSEAISLLNQHDGAKVLAGGHSLIPAMKLRLSDPGVLIDIGKIDDLHGINASKGAVTIGGLTTHSDLAASIVVPMGLSETAGTVGDQQVRNRGTIGGSVVHADPAADLPTMLVALSASFHISGPTGNRTVSAEDFFTGMFETDLEDGEILTAVEVADEQSGTGSAYSKLFNPASGYAMVGVAAVVTVASGKCTEASVVLGGLTPSVTVASLVADSLVGVKLDETSIAAAAEAVQNDLGSDVLGDIHASADYRRAMAPVYVRRAVAAAVERAG